MMDEPKNLPFGYPDFGVEKYSAVLQETEDDYGPPTVGDTFTLGDDEYVCTTVDFDQETREVYATYKISKTSPLKAKLEADLKTVEKGLAEQEAQRRKG